MGTIRANGSHRMFKERMYVVEKKVVSYFVVCKQFQTGPKYQMVRIERAYMPHRSKRREGIRKISGPLH